MLQAFPINMAANLKRSCSSSKLDQDKKRREDGGTDQFLQYETEEYLKLKKQRVTRSKCLLDIMKEVDFMMKCSKNIENAEVLFLGNDLFNPSWDETSRSWFEKEMKAAWNVMADGASIVNSPKTLREQSRFTIYLFRIPINELPKTLQQEMHSELDYMAKKAQEELEIINENLCDAAKHYNSAVGANIECTMM